MAYGNGTAFPDHPDLGGDDGQNQGPPRNYGNGNGGNNNYGQQNRNQYNGGGGGGGNYGGNRGNYGNGGGNRQWGNRNGGGNGGWKGNRSNEPEDLTLYKPYAVCGNPNPPSDILAAFDRIAKKLESHGYTLRTGCVQGIEQSVEGAVQKKELILPWRDFDGKQSKFTFSNERSKAIAKMFSPSFDTVKPAVQAFLTKNARLVLGHSCNSPALFIVVWTEDGAETQQERAGSRTGFASHPIAIANSLGIPVFNLGKPDAEKRLNAYIDGVNINVEKEQADNRAAGQQSAGHDYRGNGQQPGGYGDRGSDQSRGSSYGNGNDFHRSTGGNDFP